MLLMKKIPPKIKGLALYKIQLLFLQLAIAKPAEKPTERTSE